MVKFNDDPRLDAAFAALADPARRAIVARLSRGPATVGELAEPFDFSPPAMSKHLRVLERAGLLRQRREGRFRHCELRPSPLEEAERWLESYRRFWSAKLDDLAAYLEEPSPPRKPNHG